ncbi:MAG TPA: response regulator [Methanoregulaceae archaeon]|nr:response regulator [Methanoregulaceae archaeon]
MPSASVFIVEDELIGAEDIRQTLEDLGYTVTGITRQGESALETLRTSHPDVVLMDIHLAGTMDGIDTATRVRALYHIPVIFLTAHADETTLARAKITEPYGYVLKPFDERELHTAIEIGLYKHRMEERAQENERTIRVLANAIPDAVMLLDEDRHIIALNDAMARRLGHTYTRAQDEPAVPFDPDGMFSSLDSQIGAIFPSGRPVRFEEKCGAEWFEVSLHLIDGLQGSGQRVFVQYHDITDHKRFESELKKEGITRIEENMEQFQILNDQIRNPLQAIMGYVSLDCVRNRENIMKQIGVIDDLVSRLDHGWVESEKVRKFLLHHYRDNPDNEPGTSLPAGQREQHC